MDAALSSTQFEEPYILTSEEEKAAIDHETQRALDHYEWKLRDSGLVYEEEMRYKLSTLDRDALIDKQKVLKYANMCKHHAIWEEERRKKEIEEVRRRKTELIEFWTAKKIFALMKITSKEVFKKEFSLDTENQNLVKAVCFFLSEDPRFETELGYSFRKGLWLRGISGLGKTYIFQCAADNGLNPVLIQSMIEISESIRANGEYTIPMKNEKVLYLDDVGSEEATVNHYGTKINFLKNFIEQTYLMNQHRGFGKLVVSTNNSFTQIEEKYGFRVRSRIKDMFNVIDVSGRDRRGDRE